VLAVGALIATVFPFSTRASASAHAAEEAATGDGERYRGELVGQAA
jgi:hypothetical protein